MTAPASPAAEWIRSKTAKAPEPLLRGVAEQLGQVDASVDELPPLLAEAARTALGQVLGHPGDRRVALDLLTADALITLALLAQAEADPAELGNVAHRLVMADVAGR